jgi:hypothetical protein
MCTAMLYDPKDHYKPEETAADFKQHSKAYERLLRLKQSLFLRVFKKKSNAEGGAASGSITRKKLFFF